MLKILKARIGNVFENAEGRADQKADQKDGVQKKTGAGASLPFSQCAERKSNEIVKNIDGTFAGS